MMEEWLVEAIRVVDNAEVVVGGEALATARRLLRELDATSAMNAHMVMTTVGMVAKSWDATDPKRGYVLAAERAVRDVVVLFLVNRPGASLFGADAAAARGVFMEVAG